MFYYFPPIDLDIASIIAMKKCTEPLTFYQSKELNRIYNICPHFTEDIRSGACKKLGLSESRVRFWLRAKHIWESRKSEKRQQEKAELEEEQEWLSNISGMCIVYLVCDNGPRDCNLST